MLIFRYTNRTLVVAASMALAGCLAGTQFHTEASATPELRPELFFAGATHGVGVLEQRGKAPRKLRVEGMGRWDTDSTFRLDQKVVFDDGATENRTWHLRRRGAHAYTGTLSDASGNVTATTKRPESRNRAEIRGVFAPHEGGAEGIRTPDPLPARQVLSR